jgi:hypothetical protein
MRANAEKRVVRERERDRGGGGDRDYREAPTNMSRRCPLATRHLRPLPTLRRPHVPDTAAHASAQLAQGADSSGRVEQQRRQGILASSGSREWRSIRGRNGRRPMLPRHRGHDRSRRFPSTCIARSRQPIYLGFFTAHSTSTTSLSLSLSLFIFLSIYPRAVSTRPWRGSRLARGDLLANANGASAGILHAFAILRFFPAILNITSKVR